MGIGSADAPLVTADRWNEGACDIMAVALHRLYLLPLMAEFEYGVDAETDTECLGYLAHAWVALPDGRALDAGGIRPAFPARPNCPDPQDPWVLGYRIRSIAVDDPHFLEVRETDPEDLAADIRTMRAVDFIDANLADALAELGLHPDKTARDRLLAAPAPTP